MLEDDEQVARLLFSDQMIDPSTGKLKDAAFSTRDLIEEVDSRSGKPRSVSVDRCAMLANVHAVLEVKAETFQSTEKRRAKWGYARATARKIRSILFNLTDGIGPPFNVFEDPIEDGKYPDWDSAHAKIIRAHPSYRKGQIRGYRDKLADLFQTDMVRF